MQKNTKSLLTQPWRVNGGLCIQGVVDHFDDLPVLVLVEEGAEEKWDLLPMGVALVNQVGDGATL